MPNMDRTGPLGFGPMSGRRSGFCNNVVNINAKYGQRRSRRYGLCNNIINRDTYFQNMNIRNIYTDDNISLALKQEKLKLEKRIIQINKELNNN